MSLPVEAGASTSDVACAVADFSARADAAGIFADTHFTVLDAEAEAEALSTVIISGAAGSKKRRREAQRGSQPCHEFARSGACKYGDSCRFGHEVVKEGPDARSHMRGLAVARAARFEGGAAASAEADAGAEGEQRLEEDAVEDVALAGLSAMVGPTVTPLSMIERFYTRLFSLGVDAIRRGEDQFVHLQANRVALVGIAPAHPLLRLGLTVQSVAFDQKHFSASAPTGKHKHGAIWVEAETIIATATTTDGRTWPLRAGVRACVLEVNTRLELEPMLLTQKAPTLGHIAVLNIHLKRVFEVTNALVKEAEYEKLCAARGLPFR